MCQCNTVFLKPQQLKVMTLISMDRWWGHVSKGQPVIVKASSLFKYNIWWECVRACVWRNGKDSAQIKLVVQAFSQQLRAWMVRTEITVAFYGEGPSTGSQGDLQIYTPVLVQLALHYPSTLLWPSLLHKAGIQTLKKKKETGLGGSHCCCQLYN